MATTAPEDEGPPLNAEVMGKFQEMFADLLLEVKEESIDGLNPEVLVSGGVPHQLIGNAP